MSSEQSDGNIKLWIEYKEMMKDLESEEYGDSKPIIQETTHLCSCKGERDDCLLCLGTGTWTSVCFS